MSAKHHFPIHLACLLSFGLSLGPSPALGHYPWLLPDPTSVSPGDSAFVRMHFGHDFPNSRVLGPDRVESIRIVAPDGKQMALEHAAEGRYRTPVLDQPGIWLVSARQASAYWTRTPDGGVAGAKPEVAGAVHCNHSTNATKTLIQIGQGSSSAIEELAGHRLEIIPLQVPAFPRPDKALELRLLMDGQPWAGPIEVFRAGAGEQPVASLESDARGSIEFVPDSPGLWMILARSEQPYPDTNVCDLQTFRATLTFNLGAVQ